MTDSWNPTPEVLDSASSTCPHVHPLLELTLFRDYYQSQDEVLVLTQAGWDRKFRSWCARAERRWLEEHQAGEVKYNEWGMPINPRPMRFKEEKK